MQFASRILANTPLWAFLLLGYFVWQGVRSLKPRTLPVWRVLIVPALFIALGLSRLGFGGEAAWRSASTWLAGAILFAPLALVTGPRLLAVDRVGGRVTRPGSPVPLIRNVGVFALQYTIAVAAAVKLPGEPVMVLAGHVIAGAEAGYFACWATLFLNRYRNARGTAAAC